MSVSHSILHFEEICWPWIQRNPLSSVKQWKMKNLCLINDVILRPAVSWPNILLQQETHLISDVKPELVFVYHSLDLLSDCSVVLFYRKLRAEGLWTRSRKRDVSSLRAWTDLHGAFQWDEPLSALHTLPLRYNLHFTFLNMSPKTVIHIRSLLLGLRVWEQFYYQGWFVC